MEYDKSKVIDPKEFHEPDVRWKMFGCPDFDSYLRHYMVRGQFHDKVPNAIKEAYLTIENLIAHAYYYYPMYDEALSKTLRTMEMAVKARCKELAIPLDTIGKKKITRRTLASLIEDLSKAEIGKDIFLVMDCYRDLRNSLMHPELNSYMGGMGKPAIINSVNIFNSLFLPCSFFQSTTKRIAELRNQTAFLKTGPLTLKIGKLRFLIHSAELTTSFLSKQKEAACIHIVPIPKLPKNPTKDSGFAQPLNLFIEKIEINENKIVATNKSDQCKIEVETSQHPEDQQRLLQYTVYLNRYYLEPFKSLEHLFGLEKGKGIAEFKYEHYHLAHFD